MTAPDPFWEKDTPPPGIDCKMLPLSQSHPITHDRRGNAATPQPGAPAPGALAGAAHPLLSRSGAGPFEDGDA